MVLESSAISVAIFLKLTFLSALNSRGWFFLKQGKTLALRFLLGADERR